MFVVRTAQFVDRNARYIGRNARRVVFWRAPVSTAAALPDLSAVSSTDSVEFPPEIEVETVPAENHIDEVDSDSDDDSNPGEELTLSPLKKKKLGNYAAREVRKGLIVAGNKMERSAAKVSTSIDKLSNTVDKSMDKLSKTGNKFASAHAVMAYGIKDMGVAAKDIGVGVKGIGVAAKSFVAMQAFRFLYEESPATAMATLFVSALVFFTNDQLLKDFNGLVGI